MAITMAQKITESLRKKYGKEFGNDCVDFLGNKEIQDIPRLKTQCVVLDSVTGGGWPLGRIVEIFGGESSGKTTICYHAMAEAQKEFPDNSVGFVDSEYSFDPIYATACGVDVSQLVISQPKSGQEAFTILEGMIEEGCKVVIVDSVAAMVPKKEVEGDYGDSQMGQMGQMMSQGMRKLTSVVGRAQALVIFTNQTREKIGVMYGDPTTTPGGNALKFYASIRLKLKNLGPITEGDSKNAIRVKAEAVKNKTAPPYRQGEYVIRFGVGIDNEGLYFTEIVDRNLIPKSGNFFLIGEEKINGKVKLKAWLEEHPDFYAELKKKVDEGVVIKEDGTQSKGDAPKKEESKDEEGEV